jgi:hypothetical protein
MTKPIERDPIYRGRRFQTETIELCVRWYITYRLSYRDLGAMMVERESAARVCHLASPRLDSESVKAILAYLTSGKEGQR